MPRRATGGGATSRRRRASSTSHRVRQLQEKYVAVWIDSHATGIWFSEGTYDESTETYTHIALWDDWQTNQRGKPIKLVERFVDDDTIEASMYDLSAGAEPLLVWEQMLYRATPERKHH